MENKKEINSERLVLLQEIKKTLETPVSILGFVWLVLLIIEMIYGLSPSLKIISIVIWGLFIIDFILRFIIAPDKIAYLKKDWLIALSLFFPALRFIRMLRFVRLLSLLQGSRMVAMMASVTRGMHSLNVTLKKRGFIYLLLLTIVVILVGAAGIYAVDAGKRGGFTSYADAVFWTTMLLITIGSKYWPTSAAAKTITLLISLYGVTVLGYLTATLVSFMVEVDAEKKDEQPIEENDIAALRKEIRELANKIDNLKNDKNINS